AGDVLRLRRDVAGVGAGGVRGHGRWMMGDGGGRRRGSIFPHPSATLHYLSASPITGSTEPMRMTVSETMAPSIMYSRPWRLEKLGELMHIRHGAPVPSETRWKPSSPLGASMAW